ncbi:hypothetical protein HYG87_06250 [Methanobacterium alkalithermotolerans]|uniref:Uncharacterized protein n=1 Tax=Methanobacterium alkalithermotolerans TaxID=2731220 RepID=A0A8T8K637_9EURY|nr:hypothetical protein [Methanobacterium alkalithermotolerans]QUH23389.1 hypothetical protein HYG87_06250 [Methanobacterium alkalithermotolerans]RJS49914.1 MAG: hypothetical protein CIT03_00195 [Methanobacterium sp.]
MSRIVKFILFLGFFIFFFEAGLISSYTIVTSEPPDVGKLIDMQINRLMAIFDIREDVTSALTQPPEALNITNTNQVGQELQSKSQLDGIDLNTLNITTYADRSNEPFLVNITAMGYKEDVSGGNSSGGQIVITPSSDFMVKATAMAKYRSQGLEIDILTIKIISIGRIYNQAVNPN